MNSNQPRRKPRQNGTRQIIIDLTSLGTQDDAPIAEQPTTLEAPRDPYPHFKPSNNDTHPFFNQFKLKVLSRNKPANLRLWAPKIATPSEHPFLKQFRLKAMQQQIDFLLGQNKSLSSQDPKDDVDYTVMEHELDQAREEVEDLEEQLKAVHNTSQDFHDELEEKMIESIALDAEISEQAKEIEDLHRQLEATGDQSQVITDLRKIVVELRSYGYLGKMRLIAALGDEGAMRVMKAYT